MLDREPIQRRYKNNSTPSLRALVSAFGFAALVSGVLAGCHQEQEDIPSTAIDAGILAASSQPIASAPDQDKLKNCKNIRVTDKKEESHLDINGKRVGSNKNEHQVECMDLGLNDAMTCDQFKEEFLIKGKMPDFSDPVIIAKFKELAAKCK